VRAAARGEDGPQARPARRESTTATTPNEAALDLWRDRPQDRNLRRTGPSASWLRHAGDLRGDQHPRRQGRLYLEATESAYDRATCRHHTTRCAKRTHSQLIVRAATTALRHYARAPTPAGPRILHDPAFGIVAQAALACGGMPARTAQVAGTDAMLRGHENLAW